MIRFVDVNTGNVYNGNTPYVHWFEGKQSVGLNYDKRFIILSDKQELEIKLNSDVFYLVDPSKLLDENKVSKYDKEYYNLKTLKTTALNSTGISYSEYFIHSFNIIAQGNYVGEITDDLYIDNEHFILGADFYDENESLGINLANFGAEISNEVQRAIYEKNIDEQKVDFVLMNRKFKELLNEYINILGNKGSYKSLVNALKWFEYGELTKIYEFWKRPEPNKNYLTIKDLSSIANTRTLELLATNSKTTFIGIGCALNKIKTVDGEIVYENKYEEDLVGEQLLNEPNPVLEDNVLLWSKEDMSLKMSLLGNFFATYFMPIHLDLLFSTIEKTIYTDTIKLVSFPKLSRFDYIDNLSQIKCSIDKVYHLSQVETFTYPNTLFGFENKEKDEIDFRDEHMEILGVETSFPDTENMSEKERAEYGKAYNLQHYKGIGVIIPFKCEVILPSSDVLTYSSIKVYKNYVDYKGNIVNEEVFEKENYDIKYEYNDNKATISFNLLMKNVGYYKVQLLFRRSDGFEYVSIFDYVVDDENFPELKMYKLVPKDETFLSNFSIDTWMPESNEEIENYKSIELGSIADYVLNPVQQSILDDVIYTQFISTTEKNVATTHTNQVFVIKAVEGTDLSEIVIKRNGTTQSSSLFSIFTGGEIHGDYTRYYPEHLTDDFKSAYPGLVYIDYYKNYQDIGQYIIVQGTVDILDEFNVDSSSLSSIIKMDIVNGRSASTYIDKVGNTQQKVEFMPNVYWFTMNRFGEIVKNEIPEEDTKSEVLVDFGREGEKPIKYYIGINTDFNIPTDKNKLSYTIEKSTITKKDGTRIWLKDMFIPYFFKLEEFGTTSIFEYVALGLTDEDIFRRRNSEETYKLKKHDVVCFLPNLKCIRRPKDFMWKYNNVTLGEEIIPQTFRRFDMKIENGKIIPNDNRNTEKFPFPTILQPLFGRYDFRRLINPGYYDITLNYKLDDDYEGMSKTISSQFIVEKEKDEILYKLIRKTAHESNIGISDESLIELLTEVLYKMNDTGFDEEYIKDIAYKNRVSENNLIGILNTILSKVNEEGYDLDFLVK